MTLIFFLLFHLSLYSLIVPDKDLEKSRSTAKQCEGELILLYKGQLNSLTVSSFLHLFPRYQGSETVRKRESILQYNIRRHENWPFFSFFVSSYSSFCPCLLFSNQRVNKRPFPLLTHSSPYEYSANFNLFFENNSMKRKKGNSKYLFSFE